MKRKSFLPVLLLIPAIALLQCSKNKNENSGINLRKGLLACFKMDNDFKDSTENIEIVIFSAQGITPVADRKGNPLSAMAFDGGSMSATTDNWSANPITVSLWVKRATDDAYNYFLMANSATIGFVQDQTRMGFVISHPATSSATAEAGDGWVHLTGTYDGNEIRIYINGEPAASLAHPGEPEGISAINLALINNEYWKGSIDELRFYDRILSAGEIKTLASL